MRFREIIVFISITASFTCLADDNSNYPGKVIKTEEGKIVKVWTTKGPVAVSQAPQPFQDRDQSALPAGGVLLNIDPRVAGGVAQDAHKNSHMTMTKPDGIRKED